MKDVLPRRFVFCWFPLLLVSLSSAALAQVLEHKKPTEQLIKRYEKLIADGALLSPEGWARACKFFERPSPYPANSEIDVRSAPGIIGEATPNGNRTEIGSKWGDFYVTIDSHLQFKGTPVWASVMNGGSYSLVFVPQSPPALRSSTPGTSGEWKIEGAPIFAPPVFQRQSNISK